MPERNRLSERLVPFLAMPYLADLYKVLAQLGCILYTALMHDTPHDKNQDLMAMRLVIAITRLRARLRETAHTGATALSSSQLAILQRLRHEGPATAAALAAAEHVSHQAITQSLSALKQAGLIQTTPDPTDGRKRLISTTEAGQNLFYRFAASWLVQAIDKTISPEELPMLDRAIELLERLA